MTFNSKKTRKNEYVQTFIVIVLIVATVFGFWYGGQIAFNTKIPPALAVVSGSMCIPYDSNCDGWTHLFDHTLHIGDIIVIQGIDPVDLKTNYPNSDIIVFHRPDNPDELVVHRIVAITSVDNKTYFFTKGDGNSPPDTWPTIPQPYERDPWYSGNSSIPQGGVSQDLIVGKVVMRIPWVGHIAIFMHDVLGVNNSYIAIPIIVLLIILLIFVEFVAPLLKKKPAVQQRKPA